VHCVVITAVCPVATTLLIEQLVGQTQRDTRALLYSHLQIATTNLYQVLWLALAHTHMLIQDITWRLSLVPRPCVALRLVVPVTINGMGISREAIGATLFSSFVSSVTVVNLFAPGLAGVVGLFI